MYKYKHDDHLTISGNPFESFDLPGYIRYWRLNIIGPPRLVPALRSSVGSLDCSEPVRLCTVGDSALLLNAQHNHNTALACLFQTDAKKKDTQSMTARIK